MSASTHRTLAERLYALGLHLYPRDFRRAYGDAMQQAFRDRQRLHSDTSALRRLTETLGDLTGSAATEHWRVQCENSSLRNTVVFALVLMLAGSIAFQAQLRERFDAALDAGIMAPGAALAAVAERQRAQHMLALATTLSQASTPREALIGRHAARVASWFANGLDSEPAIDAAAYDRLVTAARDDAIALQLAAWLCLDIPDSCDSTQAITRLTQIDRDNAVTWLLLAQSLVASHASDAEIAAAYQQAAQAPQFDSFAAPMAAIWLRAYAAVPHTTPRWLRWGAHDARLQRQDRALPIVLAHFAQPVFFCPRTIDNGSDALRQACAAVAQRWVGSADTLAQRLLFAEAARRLDLSTDAGQKSRLKRQYDRVQTLLWNGTWPFDTPLEIAETYEREGDIGIARRLLQADGDTSMQ